jgi:hypothetical protein
LRESTEGLYYLECDILHKYSDALGNALSRIASDQSAIAFKFLVIDHQAIALVESTYLLLQSDRWIYQVY